MREPGGAFLPRNPAQPNATGVRGELKQTGAGGAHSTPVSGLFGKLPEKRRMDTPATRAARNSNNSQSAGNGADATFDCAGSAAMR